MVTSKDRLGTGGKEIGGGEVGGEDCLALRRIENLKRISFNLTDIIS